MTDAPPLAQRTDKTCYLIVCKDGPDAPHLRGEHLDGHLDHVEKHWRSYVTAGPMREPGGDAIVGSVFLLLADSLEEAKGVMEGDPYISCGMYQSIDYKEFTNSIGAYIGGKIWDDREAIRGRAAGGPPVR